MRTFSAQAATAGLLASFVGFASSFAVVLQGLIAVGASRAEAASGLMALAIAMGLCAIVLSLQRRQPISVAWSTPGAALLAASGMPAGGFPAAVGAFLFCGALIVVAGLWKPLGRWVASIPASLANAMLAGILLGLCLAPARAVAALPLQGLAIVVAWAVMARLRRIYAVPAAVVVAAAMIWLGADGVSVPLADIWPRPVLVTPVFDWAAMIGIGLPLFIVTMASQNIPGMAVLQVNGYRPEPGPLFRTTGIFSLLGAPFGAHAVNLAAITAAMCAGPDAHPDRERRYWAAVVAGIGYVAFGLAAGAATAFVAAAPPVLIEAVAGLALLGAFAAAMMGAVSELRDREAAVITFLVTASGIAFFGIGGAFWGLLAGGGMLALSRWRA
ncbi:benzoate membrane transport protein [Stella humosa]|uniref:Benzoate membrane transport protein n=1 Tax=Stella humosa TaxID=94 RepID=A0A3N1L343_9PROT|nr:benzoate/H(+) symporter BenE family transporter [Stella humosa]ROP83835.1 benzoate membrane transport protein [Stella humosa]BBK32904.1 benzoate transporter [Stella humosa]